MRDDESTIAESFHYRLGFSGCPAFWSSPSIGQIGIRNLAGTVRDRQHEPLCGALVQVENGVTMGVVSYITNRDGKYTFKRLDEDTDYRLWVNFRGAKSKVRKLSQFDTNEPKIIDFTFNLH